MNWGNAAIGKINSVLHGLEATISAGASTITDPAFKAPPAEYGDYAFILHCLASLNDIGRAGIVCPQGVLFRGQPKVEEETGDFDDAGNPQIKRRKADGEHLIRRALFESRLIDAVISLPLNCFYGAGVPACLLILKKQRPPERHDQKSLLHDLLTGTVRVSDCDLT